MIKQQVGRIVLQRADIVALQMSAATNRERHEAAELEILELKEELLDEKNSKAYISYYWQGCAETYRHQLSALQSNTASTGNKETIVGNEEAESTSHTERGKRDNHGTSYGMARERIRIKSLKVACEKRHAALKVRYDNLRHKAVKLELPLDRVRVTADIEKQQTMVVKEMEDLMAWLHEITKDLTERDLRLLDLLDLPRHQGAQEV
jgi:hypothetical protein